MSRTRRRRVRGVGTREGSAAAIEAEPSGQESPDIEVVGALGVPAGSATGDPRDKAIIGEALRRPGNSVLGERQLGCDLPNVCLDDAATALDPRHKGENLQDG